jgi:hypothetical protein
VSRGLTDSRILKYKAILLEKDDLTLTADKALNPVTFLEEEAGRRSSHTQMFGYYWIPKESKARPQGNSFPDWVPLLYGWSSRVIEGKRHNG